MQPRMWRQRWIMTSRGGYWILSTLNGATWLVRFICLCDNINYITVSCEMPGCVGDSQSFLIQGDLNGKLLNNWSKPRCEIWVSGQVSNRSSLKGPSITRFILQLTNLAIQATTTNKWQNKLEHLWMNKLTNPGIDLIGRFIEKLKFQFRLAVVRRAFQLREPVRPGTRLHRTKHLCEHF